MSTGTSEIPTAIDLTETAPVSTAIEVIVKELKRAQEAITGVRGPVRELAESYQRYLARQEAVKGRPPWYPYVGSGLGRGPLVQLADGSVKWDMISGIGVHMFGHGDPDLVARALKAAISDTVMQGNLQFGTEVIEFAEFLLGEAGRSSRLAHCFLINSGALANESALKVCLQHNSPASRVLAFAGGFAGRTTSLVQIGDSAAGREGLPLSVAVDYVPFYDPRRPEESTGEALKRLRQLIDRYPGGHACFIMELVQGEGGFNIAPREYFVALMELCRDRSIAVWLDEIQTFGRTLKMFYFDQLKLGEYVDVVTLGKLSQVCACLYTDEYRPQPGLLSATFVGSTVALAVGLRMLERLASGGYYGPAGRIAALQAAFGTRMDELVDRNPAWFSPRNDADGAAAGCFYDGVGGMMRFTPFAGDKTRVMGALRVMFDEGVIAFGCGRNPHHIRFLPPIGVMQPADFDGVFEVVEAALEKAARRDP